MSFEINFSTCELFSDYKILASYPLQRRLSKAQRYPIIGSVPVSFCKAVYSAAEIIIGLVGAILMGIGSLFASMRYKGRLSHNAFTCVAHIGIGSVALIYSAANFFTIGGVGFIAERY